jgi:hypothetical protein
MHRSTVSSSNITSIGYDATQEVLEVEFRDGAIYQYLGVPEMLYKGLMAASSHGTYLDTHIKKGGFKYKRVA